VPPKVMSSSFTVQTGRNCLAPGLGIHRPSMGFKPSCLGCPIGPISLKFGVFPRWSLVQVMQVYEVAWGKYLGMGCM
jgi:hypothetical protein